MKTVYVTLDHHGDDGTVLEGRILHDVSNERFRALERNGLGREATDEEVEAGYQPTIDADPSKDGGEKQAPTPANKQAPRPATKGA